MSKTQPFTVFVSHTHTDMKLVDALRDLLYGVFEDDVQLKYSSSSRPGEGIQPGEPWLQWIQRQVHESDLTIVMLTAESVNKPWVLWETGAVTGASLTPSIGPQSEPTESKMVVPIMMGIQAEQIPSPLQSLKAIYGEAQGIKPLVDQINGRRRFVKDRLLELAFNAAIVGYAAKIEEALRGRPLPLGEPEINEWLARLDDLQRQGRSAEVEHYHRAMLLAFTSEANREGASLDIRLHRRLGDMYLSGKRPQLAIEQFRKASSLAHGKDLFLLHKLGLALVQAKRLEEAQQIVQQIGQLDPEAERNNPEIGGLVGRLYRERWENHGARGDLERARDAYRAALEVGERSGQRSYYMADNVGQLSLLLDDTAAARKAFETAREFVRSSGETSVWAVATLAAACLALGDEDEGFRAIESLRALKPQPRDLDSISKGFGRIREGLKIPSETFEGWQARLLGETV